MHDLESCVVVAAFEEHDAEFEVIGNVVFIDGIGRFEGLSSAVEVTAHFEHASFEAVERRKFLRLFRFGQAIDNAVEDGFCGGEIVGFDIGIDEFF